MAHQKIDPQLLGAEHKRRIATLCRIKGIPKAEVARQERIPITQVINIVNEYIYSGRQLRPKYGYNSMVGTIPSFDEAPTELQFKNGKDAPYYGCELEQLNAITKGPRLFEFPSVDIEALFKIDTRTIYDLGPGN